LNGDVCLTRDQAYCKPLNVLTKTAAPVYAEEHIRVKRGVSRLHQDSHDCGDAQGTGEQITTRTPLGRFGEPEEMAEIGVWLCSERATYAMGAAYAVDGGWTAI
jgi:NAD(P)-dependent dehydrogenase (short-subunit alcohol dehydrogenase family)